MAFIAKANQEPEAMESSSTQESVKDQKEAKTKLNMHLMGTAKWANAAHYYCKCLETRFGIREENLRTGFLKKLNR